MAWSSFRNVLASPSSGSSLKDAPVDEVSRQPKPDIALPKANLDAFDSAMKRTSAARAEKPLSLDSIGQRDEVVRQRINAMMDRLEDLRTLEEDFSSILEPIISISDELPRASMRIAELETSLAQEFQSSRTIRLEVAELLTRSAGLATELSDALARADRSENQLRAADATIADQRIEIRDKALSIENMERQLFAEAEQVKALSGENKALRLEAQAADSALARSEHELLGARESLGVLDADNRRMTTLNEEQAVQLSELESRHRSLEALADVERHRLRAAESQLASEVAARERNEAQHETDLSFLRTERSGLAMKLEAATNRAESNEQLLGQARNQLREKDEAHRIADRNFKEASIARTTAERRLDSLQTDLARQTERFLDMQRLRGELESRCDMLGKALAAREAAVEQAGIRNAALVERIEQMTHRQEAARAEFELANRRLTEDLQNERSERALVQGALDIARETRVSLQKQYEVLKRSGRGWRAGEEDASPVGAEPTSEPVSNVRPFNAAVQN
ncbi:chromosome partitioning protein ParA [Methylobacterium sp. HMF5984]|uniref:chromosome partitioning protein ParA n=1 Tax=Methylobacterium sp. HMF5984 TaxID=3367370 RepID=UPI0038547EDD